MKWMYDLDGFYQRARGLTNLIWGVKKMLGLGEIMYICMYGSYDTCRIKY